MTTEHSLIEVCTRLTDGISRSTLFIRSRLHSVNDPSGYGIGESFDLIQRHRASLTALKTTSRGGQKSQDVVAGLSHTPQKGRFSTRQTCFRRTRAFEP